jgi:hypothetical protein
MQLPSWTFWDYVSLSELVVLLSPLYFWFTTYNVIHLIAFAGIILTMGITESIKHFVLPTWSRPSGAKGCDLLCLSPNDEGKPGMPSGHMSSLGFYAGFYKITDPFFYVYGLLVAASRWAKRCHTPAQITAGAVMGTGLGYAGRELSAKFE